MRVIAGLIVIVAFIWMVGLPFIGVLLLFWVLTALANFALGGDK